MWSHRLSHCFNLSRQHEGSGMTIRPLVRVLEAMEPIPLGYSYEIRVELVDVDGMRQAAPAIGTIGDAGQGA